MRQTSLFNNQDFQESAACCLLQTVTGMGIDEARDALRKAGGIHKLAQAPESMLALLPGIGVKRAAKIKAMTEWALMLQTQKFEEKQVIRTVADAANLVMLDMSLLEREELRVIVLNTKHHVRCIETVYVGSVNSALIRVGEVFRSAILHNAASIILVHNHPSGDPTPSPEDIHATESIRKAGQNLDIEVLDHMIVAGNRYTSLKERGLGFS